MKKKLISGILATMFLVTMITVALPAQVSAVDYPGGEVKVGIVGPKGWIQWDGLWEAAQFGAGIINKEPGTDYGPGGKYYMPGPQGINTPDGLAKLVPIDIDEHSVPAPDPSAAIAELLTKLDANLDMLQIWGGFRTECVAPMEEAAMDYAAVNKRPIWTICGAATDFLISQIQANYARYKYMFRVTPLNSTVMARTFGSMIKQIVAPKLANLYKSTGTPFPGDLVPTEVIAENLVWCDSMVAFLQGSGAAFGMNIVGVRRPSPVATDFSADISAATGAGAKLVIHIFSAVAGANFIKQVGALKPKFACVGINVESQMQEFYPSVAGACEYEAFLASAGTQEGRPPEQSQNPDAKPLVSTQIWTLWEEIYKHAPIYTAWGAYDAMIGANETAYDTASDMGSMKWRKQALAGVPGAMDKLILHTETLGLSDNPGNNWGRIQLPGDPSGRWYRSGMLGYFSYSGPRSSLNPAGPTGGPDQGGFHDPFCTIYSLYPVDDGVVRAFIPQWQEGRMEVTYPRDRLFSTKWIIPPWLYPNPDDPTKPFETDIASAFVTPDWNITTPNGVVYSEDLAAITSVWFSTPPYNYLESDMRPYDHFIDVYDAAKIGKDWLKTSAGQ